jgi:hypothetical protein
MGLMFAGKDSLESFKMASKMSVAPDNPVRVNSMDSQQAKKMDA